MLARRVPFYYLLLATLVSGLTVYILLLRSVSLASGRNPAPTASTGENTNNCKTNVVRLGSYQYIKPVLYVDRECESEGLATIKESISSLIENEKVSGRISSASVYVKLLSRTEWTGVNIEGQYHPASLNKLPLLITYLRMAELYPGIMQTKFKYEKHNEELSNPYYISKQIVPGHTYTVKELLHCMIAYSDNDATALLLNHADMNIYGKLYTDLGLPKPDLYKSEMFVSPKEYSLFMRVLYSSSYLSGPFSEYAAELLTQCDFKEGLLKDMPQTVKVAHKFGEWNNGKVYELHESGIVYLNNNPYLITIMTKGADYKTLAKTISDISNMVYCNLAANKLG